MAETTDVTTTERTQISIGNNGLQLTNISELHRFSAAIAKSPFAPRDFKDADSIMVALQMGMEVGLKPMQSLQSIAVINGRPTVWGDAAKALVLASGLCEDFSESFEGDNGNRKDLTAVCAIKRKGIATPTVGRFSIADAERAGLLNKQGPWTQYPRRMLQMRARSFAIRDAFPDVMRGLGTAEEVGDYTPEDNVRPLAKATAQHVNSDVPTIKARPIAPYADPDSTPTHATPTPAPTAAPTEQEVFL